MNNSADDRDDEDFEDEDNLSVPAGPLRITLGLAMMTGGVVVAALSDKGWMEAIGLLMFIGSIFVMLKNPDGRDEN